MHTNCVKNGLPMFNIVLLLLLLSFVSAPGLTLDSGRGRERQIKRTSQPGIQLVEEMRDNEKKEKDAMGQQPNMASSLWKKWAKGEEKKGEMP